MEEEEREAVVKAEAAAYRLLARRGYGVVELSEKLKGKDHPEGAVRVVVEGLKEAGYLDDRRFGEHQAGILVRKEFGPARIRQKLRSRGLEESLVEEVVSEVATAEVFREAARSRMIRRYGEPQAMDESTRGRAYRHLVRRGYSPGLVRGLLFDG